MILTDARAVIVDLLEQVSPGVPVHGSMPGTVDGSGCILLLPGDDWLAPRGIGIYETNWTVRVLSGSLAGWEQAAGIAETAWKACRGLATVSGLRALEYHAQATVFSTEFDVTLMMEDD